jgi:hypothetical protein
MGMPILYVAHVTFSLWKFLGSVLLTGFSWFARDLQANSKAVHVNTRRPWPYLFQIQHSVCCHSVLYSPCSCNTVVEETEDGNKRNRTSYAECEHGSSFTCD